MKKKVPLKLTRTAKCTRTVDLADLITRLKSDLPYVKSIYIFGSRRFATGSVRSDIDLLFISADDKLNYQLPPLIRRIEPYLDVFQMIGSVAISHANHSQIRASSKKRLLGELRAELIWSREKGWVGGEFKTHEVLAGAHPEYTDTHFEPGVLDPAERHASVVVVTALFEEYEAICNRLKKFPKISHEFLDIGELFSIKKDRNSYRRIVVVCSTRMGPVPAALETILAINFWKPTLVLLGGIAAGVKGKVELGDIVMPDRIIEYEAVKLQSGQSGFHGVILTSSAEYRMRIERWPRKDHWLRQKGKILPKSRAAVRIHTDGVASGSKLVADPAFLDGLGPLSRKVCAIEMEAIGVAEACHVLTKPTPFLVLKGITDFADGDKSDQYHDIVCENIADLIALLFQDGVL